MFLSSFANANEFSEDELKPIKDNWLPDNPSRVLEKHYFDFTCDGKKDLLLTSVITNHYNNDHIRLVFVTKHNGEIEAVPQFIYYEKENKFTNYVCGTAQDSYKISSEKIETSAIEKSIKDRFYCDTNVFVEVAGCKSSPIYTMMSEGAIGMHMSLIEAAPED